MRLRCARKELNTRRTFLARAVCLLIRAPRARAAICLPLIHSRSQDLIRAGERVRERESEEVEDTH